MRNELTVILVQSLVDKSRTLTKQDAAGTDLSGHDQTGTKQSVCLFPILYPLEGFAVINRSLLVFLLLTVTELVSIGLVEAFHM